MAGCLCFALEQLDIQFAFPLPVDTRLENRFTDEARECDRWFTFTSLPFARYQEAHKVAHDAAR